jgi:hypothetical protein
MVLSVSGADPENDAAEPPVFTMSALDPICRFAVALARVVALILLTVPFAFVT